MDDRSKYELKPILLEINRKKKRKILLGKDFFKT